MSTSAYSWMAFHPVSRYDNYVKQIVSYLGKIALWGILVIPMILSGSELSKSLYEARNYGKKDPVKIMRQIYEEVKELGKFPGDDFIKREFFVGKDDDDTYQNIHALVLIQNIEGIEKVTIQVTYFKPSENDRTVKYAENMKVICYALLKDEIAIIKSDYSEKERNKFLPQVLRAILGKKKLLKKTWVDSKAFFLSILRSDTRNGESGSNPQMHRLLS
jgi:hypothetical protein